MNLKLGLIGDNISRSSAPLLHRLAGTQSGVQVQYDRLVPKDMALDFEQVFDGCKAGGFRGINVTYPYKERVVDLVQVDDPLLKAMGAVNTVIFDKGSAQGHNTDFTGFMAAYRSIRGQAQPGTVLMIGTGGVGRAVAFGLARLGATALRLVDRDPAKAQALAHALHQVAPELEVTTWIEPEDAAQGATGLINCTPVGMVGYEGTPLPRAAMAGADWAFDAVYTPIDTQFLTDAAAQGLSVLSGWELFFYQGVQAWKLFSGSTLDESSFRNDLLQAGEAT